MWFKPQWGLVTLSLMPEPSLQRLRKLRDRAQVLLQFVKSDLTPFLHQHDRETFRRKPESPSNQDDVNVTTTCSCVMALALSNSFRSFYDCKNNESTAKDKASSIFGKLINAPWMSSGLTINNAFSTALVLRTYGFLNEDCLLDLNSIEDKPWESHVGIKDFGGLAKLIHSRENVLEKFLYASLREKTRNDLNGYVAADGDEATKFLEKLRASLNLDIRRLIESGCIYSNERFPNITTDLIEKLNEWPSGYELVSLNQQLFVEQLSDYFEAPHKLKLDQIACTIASDPKNFAINEYSATAALIYWFVDAIERGNFTLDGDLWLKLSNWALQEFNKQRSLVLAGHDAMMDPIAMAMAACLCSKLRRIAGQEELGIEQSHRENLPSIIELEHSIQELFKCQTPSGIWSKYFPLFHYQDAGSNFCFTFEMLEAVLYEFGRIEYTLLDHEDFISGLESAVTWCEKNRLNCYEDPREYSGWNSGGDIESLNKERPESWATAVVHMFLWELYMVTAQHIQKRVLAKYQARAPKKTIEQLVNELEPGEVNQQSIRKLLDIQLYIDRKHDSLAEVLCKDLIGRNFGKTEFHLRKQKCKRPISALLFGPPGTSKTEITKAIADDLGWPMIEINPSEFVKGSFENVYLQAEEIFTDLMDLCAVVILFDEMDALTQKRGPGGGANSQSHLDTATQFLTTSMLPKLTALHDKAGVVFFMATNFQDNFDPAIKRAGRFDFLLCMGPPTVEEKLKKIETFFDSQLQKDQREKATSALQDYLDDSPKHKAIFELLTFGDCRSLMNRIGEATNLGDKLTTSTAKGDFYQLLDEYSESISLKYKDLSKLDEGDINLEEIDKKPDEELEELLETKGIHETELAQYLRDRRVSRRQF